MIHRTVEVTLALAGAAPLLLSAWLVRAPAVEPVTPPAAPVEARSTDTIRRLPMLETWAARRTPFRASGQPPPARFGTAPVAAESPDPPAPKPTPVLTGILWSAEPAAILEGLPGTEAATLVRPGQRIGPIRVQRIASQFVELSGLDTTWVLKVREPW